MAGHYPLTKREEPEIFKTIENLKHAIALQSVFHEDFKKFAVTDKRSVYEVMKLSDSFVESPKNELAFKVGIFSLKSITDEDASITQNIFLEVHLRYTRTGVLKLKNIFWVA